MIKITVEVNGQSQTFEYETCSIKEECGFLKVYDGMSQRQDVVPSVNRKLIIEAWTKETWDKIMGR